MSDCSTEGFSAKSPSPTGASLGKNVFNEGKGSQKSKDFYVYIVECRYPQIEGSFNFTVMGAAEEEVREYITDKLKTAEIVSVSLSFSVKSFRRVNEAGTLKCTSKSGSYVKVKHWTLVSGQENAAK